MPEAICYVSSMNSYDALFFGALSSFTPFRFEVDGSLVIDDLDAVAEHAQVQACAFLRAAALMP